MRSKRVHLLLMAVIASALTLSQVAAAAQMPVKFNAADQAVARAVVLKRADVGSVAGWKGGISKNDFSQSACGGYEPKRSDLLVTGATASEWRHPSGVSFMSEVWVLKTSAMVSLDWQRTVGHTGYMACVAKQAFPTKPGTRMISYKQTAFPKFGTFSTRHRLLVEYSDRETTVKMMFDLVLIAKGRTEISLVAVGSYADRQALDAAEARMARALVNRATA
jgi:hypothetical protein